MHLPDIGGHGVFRLEGEETRAASTCRMHRIDQPAGGDHLQGPCPPALMDLRRGGMVETCRDREIGSIVSLDRRNGLVDEFGIALGTVLHLDQDAEPAAAPGEHLVEGWN